ncbi:MAG TPA: hypothetical protein VLE43_08270 [Candidatus Saccharimonadia bacterium]|nr:hypothetical protein [Candidatus Saccharimonadia bacterium]
MDSHTAKLLADLSAMDFLLQRETPLGEGRQALALILLESIRAAVEGTIHAGYVANELSLAVRSAFEGSFALRTLTSSFEKAGIADGRAVATESLSQRVREAIDHLRKAALDVVKQKME